MDVDHDFDIEEWQIVEDDGVKDYELVAGPQRFDELHEDGGDEDENG